MGGRVGSSLHGHGHPTWWQGWEVLPSVWAARAQDFLFLEPLGIVWKQERRKGMGQAWWGGRGGLGLGLGLTLMTLTLTLPITKSPSQSKAKAPHTTHTVPESQGGTKRANVGGTSAPRDGFSPHPFLHV